MRNILFILIILSSFSSFAQKTGRAIRPNLFVTSTTECNYNTQTLSGTTDTLVVANGVNGVLDISGNSTIRIEPTATCNTGNITVICDASGYTIEFVSDYTMEVSPYLSATTKVITTTATTGALDCYSWWFDGVRIFINGTKNYE